MNRLILSSALALGIAFTAAPASAVVYCKSVGVPKGCVACPVAPGAVAIAPPKPGNVNGGMNRLGTLR